MTVADLFARLSLKVDRGSFTAADRLIGGVKKALVGLATIQTARFFAGMVQETVDLASRFVDLSAQIGVGVEALQQLSYAAEQSGATGEELATGLKTLSRTMFDARTGAKDQAEIFRALGVSIKGAGGGMRSADDVLADLADSFASMKDGPTKTALAMKLFGRSGATMIPLLNQGRRGLSALRQEFVALGGQIDGQTAAALEELGDKQAKLRVAWQGMKNQLAITLLPMLQSAADRVIEWVKANKDLIRQKLQEWVARAVEVAKQLWSAFQQLVQVARDLWPTVQAIVGVIQSMIEAVGGGANAVKILLGVWLAFKTAGIALSIAGVVTQLFQMATAAKAAAVAAGGLKGIGSMLGKAGLVGAAGAAGYAVGSFLDDKLGISDKLLGVGDFRDPVHERDKARRRRLKQLGQLGGTIAPEAAEVPTYREGAAGARGASIGPTTVNVTVPPHLATKEAGNFIGRAIREYHERMLRDAAAGVGE